MTYRTVGSITADELHTALIDGGHIGIKNAIHQIALFIRLGGDPADHNYARLSFKVQALRQKGIPVASSRHAGIWLDA